MPPCIEFINYEQVGKANELKFMAVLEDSEIINLAT